MLSSLGLSQTQSHEDIKGSSSTLPGYLVTTSQCGAITKWYCIRLKDILGSSGAGSSKPSMQASGLRCQMRAAELPDRWQWCSLYSQLHYPLTPPTPEPVRFAWWLPTPLFALLSDATTFIFLRVSAKYFGPPSDVFLPIIVTRWGLN